MSSGGLSICPWQDPPPHKIFFTSKKIFPLSLFYAFLDVLCHLECSKKILPKNFFHPKFFWVRQGATQCYQAFLVSGTLGVIGNFWVIVVILSSPSMRKKLINILLTSQSCLDFTCALLLILSRRVKVFVLEGAWTFWCVWYITAFFCFHHCNLKRFKVWQTSGSFHWSRNRPMEQAETDLSCSIFLVFV